MTRMVMRRERKRKRKRRMKSKAGLLLREVSE